MARTPELAAAYTAAAYRIFLPGGTCTLRIGVSDDVWRRHLQACAASGFTILTAHNPASQLLDAASNRQRQEELWQTLLTAGFQVYRGENLADDGRWPVEDSGCVLDMPLDAATRIALKYGQSAIVIGGGDAVPQLYWIEGRQA